MKEGRTARVDAIGLDFTEGVERDELSQVFNGANEARLFKPTRSKKYLASAIEHFLRLAARACCEDHRSICQERRRRHCACGSERFFELDLGGAVRPSEI